jgi:hypothetical protein
MGRLRLAFVVVFFIVAGAAILAVGSKKALYVGRTLAGVADETQGVMVTDTVLVFQPDQAKTYIEHEGFVHLSTCPIIAGYRGLRTISSSDVPKYQPCISCRPDRSYADQRSPLADPEVQRAIEIGAAKKAGDHVFTGFASAGFGESFSSGLAGGIQRDGSFLVVIAAPFGRIAYLAQEAKRLYRPFTAADVTPEMRDPSLFVSVEPDKPGFDSTGRTYSVPAPIQVVVIKSRVNGSVVLQPSELKLENVDFGNLMGGKVIGNRATMRFAIDDFRQLPAGDADLVVVTEAGERKAKLTLKDRQKVVK